MDVLKQITKDFFKILPCLVVAYYDQKRRVSIKELQESAGLTGNQCKSTITLLLNAQILHSNVGGANRGYLFFKDPKEISVHEVIKVLQGIAYSQCNVKSLTQTSEECLICKAINKGIAKMVEELQQITLYDFFMDLSPEKVKNLRK